MKDALNERAAQAYCDRVECPLHWYYAINTHNKQNINDPELRSTFKSMNSAITNQWLGRILLAPGMPVVFAVNFDVQDGIINGMVGTVNTIYYYTDNEDR